MFNEVIRSRLSYRDRVFKYLGYNDNDAEVINRVLYNHRTIAESDVEKPVLPLLTELSYGENIARDTNNDADVVNRAI